MISVGFLKFPNFETILCQVHEMARGVGCGWCGEEQDRYHQ